MSDATSDTAGNDDDLPGVGLRVGVLALQGDVREHLSALADCGAQAVPVRRPAELDSVDALILPGGESTTISKLAVTFDLMEPLRERIAAGMPAYGSCAGMILLADRILDGPADQQSIGGLDVTVRRNAFGRQVDSFEEAVQVAGVAGDPFPAVFIRAPWVEEVGSRATVLARVGTAPDAVESGAGKSGVAELSASELGTVESGAAEASAAASGAAEASAAASGAAEADAAASGATEARAGRVVVVRQGSLLATSFHPELSGDARMHRYFCQMVQQARIAAGAA